MSSKLIPFKQDSGHGPLLGRLIADYGDQACVWKLI